MKSVLFILFAAVLFFAACSNDTSVMDKNNNNQLGMLKLSLTDKPITGMKQVWVTMTNIEVHKTGGNWITFAATTDSVDLLTLKNREQVLQSHPLDPGSYTGIRLDVTDGHIIESDDSRCDLKIPSSKIEIPVNFKIGQGQETDMVLDFNADKSVHVIQTGHNGQCIMRPVILVKSVSQSNNG